MPFFLQAMNGRENVNKLQKKSKINFNKKKKFCCIITSNESSFDRINFFKKLSEYKKIDFFGKTKFTNSNNKLLPICWSKNYKFLSKYKFVISFENSFEKEYITEKLPNAMLANSIPIYKGAQNISEYFKTKSFVNFDNYGRSYDQMIKKIIELDNNNRKYKKFLKEPWLNKKNKEKIKNKEKELKDFLSKVIEE